MQTEDERRQHQRRTRLTALIVACALFMQNLDGTVIATALPTMAKDFGADPVRMNVALTSYLLSLTVFIPASGWVADRFGTRNVFRSAIIVFTIGSILCGQPTANLAWGDDGHTLYITSKDRLLRVKTKVKGAGF